MKRALWNSYVWGPTNSWIDRKVLLLYRTARNKGLYTNFRERGERTSVRKQMNFSGKQGGF